MYILINIIIIAILIQAGIIVTNFAFEFGRDFMIQFVSEDYEEEYEVEEAYEVENEEI